ncbi:hypothetical protein Glove_450g4 [Diversispora epigaea]|uniref:Uncharacterized protein n=1 Tax=Diversispora epigaea TaxID=1348612 RepID=A0A397GYM0_9GLOM|nr:hypothetical protein Glove_450g4 [Diversispora epigaea]
MSFQLSFVNLDQTYAEIKTDINFDVSFMSGSTIQINTNSDHSQISQRTSQLQITVHNFLPWTLSKKLENLKNRFENVILYQFPCIPCSYCSRLIYPCDAKWIIHNQETNYPLEKMFPHIPLQFHPNQSILKIAVCCLCIKPFTHHSSPVLNPVPIEIEAIPLYYQIYLSPIHLSCSLGRTPESNNFTNYCHLQGSFGYSKNINAFLLYTGTIGAMLNNGNNSWYHLTLPNAANWLWNNNPLFYPYNHFYTRGNSGEAPLILPIANLITDNNLPLQLSPGPSDLVIQNENFDNEIHNEDYHFTHLIAGFLINPTDKELLISYKNPDLEAFLFPDLFPLDNYNTNLTNRSYHTYEYYHHHLKSVHKYLWKNSDLTIWGKWLHHFERDEFQNCSAIYTHGVAWLSKSISELINDNIIRADLPNPETETELYCLVIENNIHHCSLIHCNNQWVVSYHAPTLLLWEGHCNIQYITDKNFAKYICKYVTKPEPSNIFEISETDAIKRHIRARRLGTMELTMLILGKPVSRKNRCQTICPAYQLVQDFEMDPYYKDAIEKYFNHPHDQIFLNIIYQLISTVPTTRLYWRDCLNNIVVCQKKENLVRFQYLTIENTEDFFYQQLLLQTPVLNEQQLKGNYLNYQSRFQAEFPDEFQLLITNIQQKHNKTTLLCK